jgi:hypothetical protein
VKHNHTKHYSMCNGLWAREHLFLSHYHIRGRAGRACAADLFFLGVMHSIDEGFSSKGVKMSDWTFRVGPYNVRFRRNQRIKVAA